MHSSIHPSIHSFLHSSIRPFNPSSMFVNSIVSIHSIHLSNKRFPYGQVSLLSDSGGFCCSTGYSRADLQSEGLADKWWTVSKEVIPFLALLHQGSHDCHNHISFMIVMALSPASRGSSGDWYWGLLKHWITVLNWLQCVTTTNSDKQATKHNWSEHCSDGKSALQQQLHADGNASNMTACTCWASSLHQQVHTLAWNCVTVSWTPVMFACISLGFYLISWQLLNGLLSRFSCEFELVDFPRHRVRICD